MLALGAVSVTLGVADFVRHEQRQQPHVPMRTSWTDPHGKEQEIETHRGEYDSDETPPAHVARHLSEVKLLEDATK